MFLQNVPHRTSGERLRPRHFALQWVAQVTQVAAPPTLATYRSAATLSDAELDELLTAHDRQIPFYEPRVTLLASRQIQ